MKVFSNSLIATLLLSTAMVGHASQGPYFGFNIGQSNYDISLNDLAAFDDGSITSASLDDSDTSLSFTLGYQLNPNFALEGGYIDFGEFSFDLTSDGSGFIYPAGNINTTVATDGLFFDVKGLIPLSENFSLYGKFGLLKWDTKVTVSIQGGSGSESFDESDTFFGIGGSIALGNNENNSIALNIDYTLYELDDLDVDVLSVGIQFGF